MFKRRLRRRQRRCRLGGDKRERRFVFDERDAAKRVQHRQPNRYRPILYDKPENTHHRGKYYFTADLLNWFGFDERSKAVTNST